ncbi:MAG: hypothetical protein IKR47_09740 [Lachnospiraceae bacterium]|nr:hypothetical protein [Lachnospiraceae bacterium]MCR4685290.1 hypothetical protein [Lachnospiraceae bacterium]
MISPLETNAVISRTQDISILKQNEDAKGDIAHLQTQDTFDNERDQFVHTVHDADNTRESDTHHDAREKGRNEYIDQRNKQRKKKQPKDQVIAKSMHGFDIKI